MSSEASRHKCATSDGAPAVQDGVEWTRVLVFGAAGTVGQIVVPRLLQCAATLVTAAVHHTPIHPELAAHARVFCVQVDLADESSVAAAMRVCSPSRIVFMVPNAHDTKQMVQSFVNAMHATRDTQSNVHVVFVSQGDIDDWLQSRLNHYRDMSGIYKCIMESGLHVTRLEPAAFYQNMVKFYALLEALRSGPNPCWRIGIRTTARFGWVDAADIAECVANLVLNPDIEKHIGKHYQLVSSHFSVNDFVATLNEVVPCNVTCHTPSNEELKDDYLRAGLTPTLADDRVLVLSTLHDNHFPVLGAPTDDVEILCRRAPTTLRDYLVRDRALFARAANEGRAAIAATKLPQLQKSTTAASTHAVASQTCHRGKQRQRQCRLEILAVVALAAVLALSVGCRG